MSEVPEHFFRQSAVLPYRWSANGLEILMVTSRRKKRWVLPKGVHEPGLSAAESASREAWEEAGIEGDVRGEPLGTYRYKKWGGVCSVVVFPMLVRGCLEDWPERERSRAWLSPEEAIDRVSEPTLAEMIRAFAQRQRTRRASRDDLD